MVTSLADVQKLFQDKHDIVQRRVGGKKALEERISGLDAEVNQLLTESINIEKAVHLLQKYADFQQREVIHKVEDIVTSGLQFVFENPTLDFRLFYSETKGGAKKKAPEITMAVYYDYGGEQIRGDIENSFGGGLSVVVATLLRIVIVMFLDKRVRPILLLDEPLKDLSPEYPDQDSAASGYRDRMAEFLRQLTQDSNVQIIMVSHEQNYSDVADVDYRFHGGIGKSPHVSKKERQEIDGGM